MTRTEVYRHEQPGTALFWALNLLGVIAGVSVYAGTGQVAGAAAIAGIIVVSNLLFASLTVVVSRTEVRVRFGPGLIRKTFRVEDIVDARAVRNAWWYGWGIHLTPHGWLYNIAGLDAVELEMRKGRKVRIGTDEPARLLAAIREVAP